MSEMFAYIIWQIILRVTETAFCANEERTEKHGVISNKYPDRYNCSWYIKTDNNTITTIIVSEPSIDYKISIAYGKNYTIWITAVALRKEQQQNFRLLFSVRNLTVCQHFDLACLDRKGCYYIKNVCDNQFTCYDHSEERYYGKCEKDQVPCDNTSSYCFSPTKQRCNRVLNCPEEQDELNCSRKSKNQVQCHNGNGCYDQKQICDGSFLCLDNSDENNCMQFCKDQNYILCNKKCIDSRSFDNNVCDSQFSQIASTNAIGFIIFCVVVLTTCFVTLTCRSYLCRRDINTYLPQFTLPPGEIIDVKFRDSDFLHGGEVYEAFVRSRCRYDD